MADKVYAVIDTNVIVSALISKKAESYPLSVMAHVYSGVIIPVFNNEIINEYKDVLSREKFQQHRHNPPKISGLFFCYGFCDTVVLGAPQTDIPKQLLLRPNANTRLLSILTWASLKHTHPSQNGLRSHPPCFKLPHLF